MHSGPGGGRALQVVSRRFDRLTPPEQEVAPVVWRYALRRRGEINRTSKCNAVPLCAEAVTAASHLGVQVEGLIGHR
jgi:hypothetical protein